MNQSALFWVVFLCSYFPQIGQSQCFNNDPNNNYLDWNYAISVQKNFNDARRMEESDKGLAMNCLGNMSAPSGGWGAYNGEEIALYIHNSEREARGFLPLYGVESNLSSVAQAHSDWQLTNDVFAHGGDPAIGSSFSYNQCPNCSTSLAGSSPFQRMNENAPLAGQWQTEAENLAVAVTSGTVINNFVASSLYGFMYVDAGSLWGHRHGMLTSYNNDWGDVETEGFIGVGLAQGNNYQACLLGCGIWNFAKILTIDYYDPQAAAGGYAFSVLPIEFLSFTAKLEKEDVLLSWSTLSETNSDYFEVQRSVDGRNFATIANVAASGQSDEIRYYSIWDYPIERGVLYYRLKEVDFDEQSQFSDIVKVSIEKEIELNIYPNPFVDDFSFSFFNPSYNNVSYRVLNRVGQIVIEDKSCQDELIRESISLQNLPSGVYLLSVDIGEKQILKRLVKM